jgi:hypothetical protein
MLGDGIERIPLLLLSVRSMIFQASAKEILDIFSNLDFTNYIFLGHFLAAFGDESER